MSSDARRPRIGSTRGSLPVMPAQLVAELEGHGPGGTAPRAALGPADGRPVPVRPPGGGAPSLHAGSRGAWSMSSGSSRALTSNGSKRRSSPKTPSSTAGCRCTRSPCARADVCPYKGLARFETADADFFFGREQVVAEAVGHLVGRKVPRPRRCLREREVLSAACRSPPRPRSGAVPGSDRWTYSVIRPGDHPLDSVGSGDGRTPNSGPPSARHRSVRGGLQRVFRRHRTRPRSSTPSRTQPSAPDGTHHDRDRDAGGLLRTMCRASSARLAARLGPDPGRADGPRGAASSDRCSPRERAGLTRRGGARRCRSSRTPSVSQERLPLLSTALLELWTRRRDRTLRLDEYLRAGGVEGAVARLAEEAYGRLDGDGQAAAKRILLRLAAPGGDSRVGPPPSSALGVRSGSAMQDASRRDERPDRRPPRHRLRRDGRGRARGAAPRMAAAPHVARGRCGGTQASSPRHGVVRVRGTREGVTRPISTGALGSPRHGSGPRRTRRI